MPSHKKRNHFKNISRKKKGSKRSQKNVGNKKQFVSLSQFENILFGGNPDIGILTKAIVKFKKGIIKNIKKYPKLATSWKHPFFGIYPGGKIVFEKCFDVWSFGCVMVEMLQYGTEPYKNAKDIARNNNFNFASIFGLLKFTIDVIKKLNQKKKELKGYLNSPNLFTQYEKKNHEFKNEHFYEDLKKICENRSFFNLMSQSLDDIEIGPITNLIKDILASSLYEGGIGNITHFDFQLIYGELSNLSTKLNNDLLKNIVKINTASKGAKDYYVYEDIDQNSADYTENMDAFNEDEDKVNNGRIKGGASNKSQVGGAFPEITISGEGSDKGKTTYLSSSGKIELLSAEEFNLLFDINKINSAKGDNLTDKLASLYDKALRDKTLQLSPPKDLRANYEDFNSFRLLTIEAITKSEKIGIILLLAVLNKINFDNYEFNLEYNFKLQSGKKEQDEDKNVRLHNFFYLKNGEKQYFISTYGEVQENFFKELALKPEKTKKQINVEKINLIRLKIFKFINYFITSNTENTKFSMTGEVPKDNMILKQKDIQNINNIKNKTLIDSDFQIKTQDKNLLLLKQKQNEGKINYGGIIGQGQFGVVTKYKIPISNDKRKEFIVKISKPNEKGNISDITDFYKECYVANQILTSISNNELLGNLKNVVIPYAYSKSSLGYLPDGKLDVPMLVSEVCNKGDLKQYLITQKFQEPNVFTYGKFINFCQQICNGMIYLHSKGILHLDLACRNILCHQENRDMTLKISDFGLAEFLEEEEGTVPSHQEIIDFMNITQNFDPETSALYALSRELLSDKITGFTDDSKNKTDIQKLERKIGLTVSRGGSRGGARDAIRAKEKFIDMMGPKVYKSYITSLYNQAKKQYLSSSFQTVRKNSKKAVGAKGRGIKVGGAKGKKGYVRHNKSVVKLKKKTRKYIKKKSHKKKA